MMEDIMNLEKELQKIFLSFGVDYENKPELKDTHLCSVKIQFRARDLLILLYAVESVFQITIDEEAIINNEFVTYNKILNLIKEGGSPYEKIRKEE